MVSKTLYDVLGVEEHATGEEIKKAFKRMAKRFHPDVTRIEKDEAHEKFKEIAGAYRVLSNPTERMHYDHSLKHGGFKTKAEPRYEWAYLAYLDSYGWRLRTPQAWNEHHNAMYG